MHTGSGNTGSGPGLSRSVAPVLSDGVVTLRGYVAADTSAVVAYAQDPEVQRWINLPNPYTRRDAESFLATGADAWQRGTQRRFAIETQGRWCGGLDITPAGGGVAEVGYGLAGWARGSGVMRRALKLVLPWAFSTLELSAIQWKARVGNWPSRRVAWASGFQISAALPALLLDGQQPVDAWYGVLRRGDPMTPATAWFDAVTITGPGLTLRAHRDDDVPRMAEAAADPRTYHWLRLPSAPDDMRSHLLRLRSDAASGRRLTWVIADPGTGQFLGEVGVSLREPGGHQNEIGYWAHPDARGRGLMTEAVKLAARHALIPAEDGGMGLQRVFIRAAEGNSASRWVAVRAGFTEIGRERSSTTLGDDTLSDDIRYDLIASDLPAVR